MRTTLLTLVLLLALPCYGQKLELLTIEVPPMAFTEKGQLTGFCIDLIREMQKRLKDTTEISVIPWPRAYHRGLHEKNIVLICPKKTEERKNQFKWIGPILTSQTSLFQRAGAKVKIHTLEDAKKAPAILIPKIFYSYPELLSMGFNNLEAVADSQTAVRMLVGGRADLLALDRRQVNLILDRIQSPRSSVEFVLDIKPAISYFAFSKAVPDEVINKWNKAFQDTKKDGSYERIYNKWFVYSRY